MGAYEKFVSLQEKDSRIVCVDRATGEVYFDPDELPVDLAHGDWSYRFVVYPW